MANTKFFVDDEMSELLIDHARMREWNKEANTKRIVAKQVAGNAKFLDKLKGRQF